MDNSVPSFERAEYVPMAGLDPVPGFGIDQQQQRNHAAYVRAILFGVGAAIAGCILYSVVVIATGWTIGYVALAVGYMVGRAMKAGSGGQGGRRYQIAAALLTYAAVSVSAIPVAIWQQAKHPHASVTRSATRAGAGTEVGAGTDPAAVETAGEPAAARPVHGMLYGIGLLLALGLASPFMALTEGVGGILGLFILFIGIRYAWQLTAGSEFVPGRA